MQPLRASSGIVPLVQKLCEAGAMDDHDRAAFLLRFGRLSAASSITDLQVEMHKLYETIATCMDRHLGKILGASGRTVEEVRTLMLVERSAHPREVIGLVHDGTLPPESTDPLVQLIELVRTVDTWQEEVRRSTWKVVRKDATSASLAVARFAPPRDERENAPGSRPLHDKNGRHPKGGSSDVERLYAELTANHRSGPGSTRLLELFDEPETRAALQGSPSLVSRAITVLAGTRTPYNMQSKQAAALEHVLQSGTRIAGDFRHRAMGQSLEALAKMDPPANGSSHEFVLALLEGAVQRRRRLDASTIRSTLWSLSRMRYTFRDTEEYVEYACTEGVRESDRFEPGDVNSCILSLAHLGASGPRVYEFAVALCTRGTEIMRECAKNPGTAPFSTQELSNMLWGVTRLQISGPKVDGFARACAGGLCELSDKAQPRHMSMGIWSLARKMSRGGESHIRDWPECRALFRETCARGMETMDSFTSRDIANNLWALANMGHTFTVQFQEEMHALVRAMCGEAHARMRGEKGGMPHFEPQEISTCLWSLAHLGTQGEEVQSFIRAAYDYGRENIGDFSEQNANNSYWGLAVLSAKHEIPERGDVFLHRAKKLLRTDRPESVRQLYHSFIALNRREDLHLLQAINNVDMRNQLGVESGIGQTEQELVRSLQHEHAENGDPLFFESNQHYYGFQLDFISADGMLNIEIDGPHHRDRPEIDAFRDRVLRTLGIEVVRIPEEHVPSARGDIRRMLAEHQRDIFFPSPLMPDLYNGLRRHTP